MERGRRRNLRVQGSLSLLRNKLFHNQILMATFTKEWDKIRENRPTIATLEKSRKKIDRLAAFMLGGNPVTGRTMIEKFNIHSYRDAIYDLGKKGYDIQRKVITAPNGIEHVVWWLVDFSEEFVTMRNPAFFRTK